MQHLRRYLIGVAALALSISLNVPVAGAEEDDDPDAAPREECRADFACPSPDGVCCPGMKLCCPTQEQCPVDPDDTCTDALPEQEVPPM